MSAAALEARHVPNVSACVQAPSPLLHALAGTHSAPEKTAAQCGELVRYLLSLLGARGLHEAASGGASCLHAAVQRGNGGLVTALLDAGNSSAAAVAKLVRMRDGAGLTALHACAQHGHVGLARQVRTFCRQ